MITGAIKELTEVPVIEAISLNFLYTVDSVSFGGANIIF